MRITGTQKVTIVGGGPCGSVLALYLLKLGVEVDVYELREEEDEEEEDKLKSSTKRSINLALSYRGLCALEHVGAKELVMREAVEMHSRMVHQEDGEVAKQRYGTKDGESIFAVSRPRVVKLLSNLAQKRGARYHFGEKFVGFDDERRPTFASGKVGETPTFGCDGAFSATRKAMERLGRYDFHLWYAKQGYKELSIPCSSLAAKEYVFPQNFLHIWPRGDTMLIALPNVDASFTATLFGPCETLEHMEAHWSREKVQEYFQSTFPDAFEKMPDAVDEFFRNPTSPLVQLKVSPWHHQDKVLIIGDASHAVVPYYGQGMNAALEDCLALAEIISEHTSFNDDHNDNNPQKIDFKSVFLAVSDTRRKAADGLSILATRNYEDMAKNTASKTYRARKALERLVATYFPSLWLPQYSMVTFSRMPYDQVLRRESIQENALTTLCATVTLAALASLASILAYSLRFSAK